MLCVFTPHTVFQLQGRLGGEGTPGLALCPSSTLFFSFFVWKMQLNPATPLLHSLFFQGCLLVYSKVFTEEQLPPDIFGRGFQAHSRV